MVALLVKPALCAGFMQISRQGCLLHEYLYKPAGRDACSTKVTKKAASDVAAFILEALDDYSFTAITSNSPMEA